MCMQADLQQYYTAFQSFAKERRLLLSKIPDNSPSHIESDIKKEWCKMMFEANQATGYHPPS